MTGIRNKRLWVCGKCGKSVDDFMVMILLFKMPFIGVKMCGSCAKKFFAKTHKRKARKTDTVKGRNS